MRDRKHVPVVPWLQHVASMLRPLLFSVALIAACGGPGEVRPDAGDETGDAAGGPSGLVFKFVAPELDEPQGEVTITRIEAALVDLRATGDTALGDETYQPQADLQLEDPDDELRISFDEAPPGVYSAFELGLERASDDELAWSLEGTVDLDGDQYGLEVEDEETTRLSLPLGALDLGAGQTVEVTIVIGLALLVETIDWADAPIEQGETVVVDDESPALLDALRLGLASSVYVESITRID